MFFLDFCTKPINHFCWNTRNIRARHILPRSVNISNEASPAPVPKTIVATRKTKHEAVSKSRLSVSPFRATDCKWCICIIVLYTKNVIYLLLQKLRLHVSSIIAKPYTFVCIQRMHIYAGVSFMAIISIPTCQYLVLTASDKVLYCCRDQELTTRECSEPNQKSVIYSILLKTAGGAGWASVWKERAKSKTH